jgi:two-component system, sensor histidine kinase LadS
MFRSSALAYNEVVTYLTDCPFVFMRIFCFFVVLLASLWTHHSLAAPAKAWDWQAPIVLSQLGEHAPLAIGIRTQVPIGMAVEQMAAQPGSLFVPFNPQALYPLDEQHALWLHFRLAGEPSAVLGGWIAALPKTFVNRVALYARSPQGDWQGQVAGHWAAHTQWSHQGLYPQFQLPSASVGEQDIYIKVENSFPLQLAVHVWPSGVAHTHMQNEFLSIGLVLGFMSLMLLITGMYALAYKEIVYAWYALYVALGLVTSACFVGLAHYALWPGADQWPQLSSAVFLMACFTAQLVFSRAMFMPANGSKIGHAAVSVLVALSLLAMALLVLVNHLQLRVALFTGQMLVCSLALLVITLPLLRRRNQVAWLWLLANALLMPVVTLTIVQSLGLLALPWLPTKAPIYAQSFEMVVLLVALHFHAKTGHARAVRSTILAHTDPLTGFVPSHHYQDTLAQLWLKCLQAQTDMSVAYVHASMDTHARAGGGGIDKKRFTLRTVRMLRTVAREDDTIARVNDDVFAILMPGVGRSEALTAKLSRLVALGMMQDKDDRRAIPIQFKVLASSLLSSNCSPEQLHTTLSEALANPSIGKQRAIRFWPEED